MPSSHLDFVRHDVNFTFHVDEVVVVLPSDSRPGEDGLPAYHYARVLPRQRGRGESSAGELLRLYSVHEGGDAPSERTHIELFKFSNAEAPTAYEANTGSIVLRGETAASVGAEAGLAQLIAQLREIQSLPTDQYKRAVQRLWKQWHPDRSTYQHAKQGSQLLNRHIQTYHGDKDFSWLDEASMALPAAGQSDADTEDNRAQEESRPSVWGNSGAVPHTWFDEFEREERHVNNHAQQARSRDEQATVPSRRATPRAQRSDPPQQQRKVNTGFADLLWRQSAEEEASAEVLKAGGRYAAAVWHAQQACELGLKSLMLRTCGLLDDELKGREAHNLERFVAQVDGHAQCPVPGDELRALSVAYLRSRYSSAGDAQLPADRYDAADAQMALRNATVLRSWVSTLDAVTTPRSASTAWPDASTTSRRTAGAPSGVAQSFEATAAVPTPALLPANTTPRPGPFDVADTSTAIFSSTTLPGASGNRLALQTCLDQATMRLPRLQ